MQVLKPYRETIFELGKKSALIREVNAPSNTDKERYIPHFDITGSSNHYFSMGLHIFKKRFNIINLFGSFERLFLGRVFSEMKNGYGDGFVTVEASRSPLTPEENFFVLPVNHANILIDSRMWSVLKNIIRVVLNIDDLDY